MNRMICAAIVVALMLPTPGDSQTPTSPSEASPSAPGSTATPSPLPSPTSSPVAYRPPPNLTLASACSELKTTARLEADAHDAHVIASFGRERELKKQIALAYYKCADRFAKRTDDRGRYAHDKALIMYAAALRDSFTESPEPAAIVQLETAIEELRSTTPFADVHDDALALAATLPAPPTAPPTSAPVGVVACRDTNFAGIHQDWLAALRKWSADVDNTNRAGALRANILTQVNYSVQLGAEKADAAKLFNFEPQMRSAIDLMQAANTPETVRLATTILSRIHEVNGYASSFTANANRGAASISDREHLQSSKLAADAAAEDLRHLPYCSK